MLVTSSATKDALTETVEFTVRVAVQDHVTVVADGHGGAYRLHATAEAVHYGHSIHIQLVNKSCLSCAYPSCVSDEAQVLRCAAARALFHGRHRAWPGGLPVVPAP